MYELKKTNRTVFGETSNQSVSKVALLSQGLRSANGPGAVVVE